MLIPGQATRRRYHRERLDLVQREAAPRGQDGPQGQHARLQEREEDRRHPESVSAMTRETLICILL